jgi:peptidoglycan hydrolase-like protein with peptidoglycan-binding domain
MLEFGSTDDTVTNSVGSLSQTLRDQIAASASAQAKLRIQPFFNADAFQNPAQQPSRVGSLGPGSRGPAVTDLQNQLKARGFFSGNATGYYGSITQGAVDRFQQSAGLSRTGGIANPATRSALGGDTFSGASPLSQFQSPATAGTATTHVNTPFYPMTGRTDCYQKARAMAAAAGAHLPRGLGNGIQIATKSPNGNVSINSAAAARGRNYIDSELANGRPVVVGVHHPGGYHNGGAADHFVTVTGSGLDAKGNRYYTFNDPASRALGRDTNPANRFYVGQNGDLYKAGAQGGYVINRAYSLSWVGRNAESR